MKRLGLGLLLALTIAPGRAADPAAGVVAVSGDPHRLLEEARAAERTAQDELAGLELSLQQLLNEQAGLLAQRDALEATRAQHQDEARQAESDLASRRGELKTRLSALYRLRRRGLARTLFGAEDPSALRRRATYLLALLRAESAHLREFFALVERRRGAVEAVNREGEALAAVLASLDAREADLREQRNRQLTLLDDIRTRRELALRALAAVSATADPGPALPRETLPSPAGAPSFRAAFGQLPWPAMGRIVRRFGAPAASPGQLDSLGLDLAIKPGTLLRAAYDGVVKLAENVPGYGPTVALGHGDYTTVYAHLADLKVARGATVHAGESIGRIGDAPLPDGSCCLFSFEIRYNGSPQDPLPWLAPP